MKFLLIFLIIFTIGKSLNKFLKHFEPLNYQMMDLKRVSRSTDSRILLNFHAFGRDFKLILSRVQEKDSVFMKGATIEYANETVKVEWESNIFEGIVEDEENSRVFGSIRHGIFEGVIDMPNGEEFWIESSYPYNSISPFHSFIYSAKDVEMPKPTERAKRFDFPRDDLHHHHSSSSVPNNRLNSQYQNRPPHARYHDPNYEQSPFYNERPATNPPPRVRSSNYPRPYSTCYDEVEGRFKAFKGTQKKSDFETRKGSNQRKARSPYQDENGIWSNRICTLYITIDHTLYQYVFNGDGRGDELETRNQLKKMMETQLSRVNGIYKATEFGGISGINFKIAGLKIWRTADDVANPFVKETSVAKQFLDWHSEKNHDGYCLSYVFTYRSFDESIQGLAFACYLCTTVKASGDSKTAYNTGMITFQSNGNEIPERVRHLTVAHELGHSLGSGHDDMPLKSGKSEGEEYPACAYDKGKGHFIMNKHANDGNKPNHHLFSPCSLRNITRNLKRLLAIEPGIPHDKQPNCFIESNTPICGNGIVEPGEECDCGFTKDECETARDECCGPADHINPSSRCKLIQGAQCSPSQGPCCNEACEFKGAKEICSQDKDCTSDTHCLENNATCPSLKPIRDGLPCNDVTGVCQNGDCSGSICAAEGLEACESSKRTCMRHCIVQGKCMSTEHIDLFSSPNYNQIGRWGHKGLLKKANEGCRDEKGYCDAIGVCRDILLGESLAKSGANHGFKRFGEDLTKNWWILIILVIAGILILVLVALLCYYKMPKLSLRSPREKKTIPVEVVAETTAVELKATDFNAKSATADPTKGAGTEVASTLTGQWRYPESKDKKEESKEKKEKKEENKEKKKKGGK